MQISFKYNLIKIRSFDPLPQDHYHSDQCGADQRIQFWLDSFLINIDIGLSNENIYMNIVHVSFWTGNIEQLKKQHEKEISDFQKAQEMNKARLQQGLEAKLAARRNRQARSQNN